MPEMPVLRVTSLKKTYRTPDGERHTIIDIPTFELAEGRQVALRGSSGFGCPKA